MRERLQKMTQNAKHTVCSAHSWNLEAVIHFIINISELHPVILYSECLTEEYKRVNIPEEHVFLPLGNSLVGKILKNISSSKT